MPLGNLPNSYYLGLLTSEYKLATNLNAWLTAPINRLNDASSLVSQITSKFDLDTAIGTQLDKLGVIVGQGRTVTMIPGLGGPSLGANLAPVMNPTNYSLFSGSGISIVAGAAPDGSYAMVTPVSKGGYFRSLPIAVAPGASYTMTGYIDEQTGTMTGTAYWFAANSTASTIYGLAPQTAGVKGTVSVTFTVPSGVTQVYLFPTTGSVGVTVGTLIHSNPTLVQNTQAPATQATLDDTTYRTLLKARIAQNLWRGTMNELQGIWKAIFPGGQITITDSQNMTATMLITGAFTSTMQDLIANGFIVPRPEGVLYNYTFTTLPAFGTDQDTAFIAGFDHGHLT